MNKHTKAPWKVVENGGRMVGVMSKNDWVVYKAGQDRMSTEEIEANACLIAAAPDLLAALQEIYRHGIQAFGEDFEVMLEAKAALDKATSISN